MNFDEEAREIAYGFWCGNCNGPSAKPCKKHEGCYELILETEQALRRAFIAGQEDMRDEYKISLMPFAKLAQNIHPMAPNEGAVVLTTLDGGIIDTSHRITVADLRRAADALGFPLAHSLPTLSGEK